MDFQWKERTTNDATAIELKNKSLEYINYKKLKLCIQIIKTFDSGYKYINKQNINILL